MQLLESLKFGKRINVYEDIHKWQNMNPDKGLYVWGTGSVALGVVKECSKHDIKLSGFFVNVTEFNLDPRIKSAKLPIYQLRELIGSGKEFSVIIGHSHYELITEIKNYTAIQKIWSFTDIVREDITITENFVRENSEGFQITFNAFADDLSKRNMIAYLNAKITGDYKYVFDVFDKPSSYFSNDVIKLADNEIYLDLGAYDGKSMAEFIEICPSFKKILAVEVLPQMCELLQDRFKMDHRIEIKNIGISDHIGIDYFNFDDQSTYLGDDVSGTPVEVTTADTLCEGLSGISLIKICIGNTIVPLIKGAARILSKDKPKLVIAAGIDNRALLDYVPLIDSVSGGGYQYYLRFTNAMTEAMVLYAIPRK